ncbi:MAG: Mpo1-like protein [Reichenbachiella sp.]|uniref:Mpo1 family 2-hydroxy fatty acid dioxygenase n=1 Tax=Reichenbachiella sp. TaxID=2184521 RepID=UPI0032650CA6
MRKIDQLLSEYGESHQNETNKIIHWICVPVIFWSIIGLVWSIPNDWLLIALPNVTSPFLNWATLILVVVLLYYFTLSFWLFFGMSIVVVGFLYITLFVEQLGIAPLWLISVVVFVIAWIGQFYGHHVEGKKPSFLKDVQFLLIGPAWLMHFIYKKLNIPY